MRIDLLGESYLSRSALSSCARQLNLYSEVIDPKQGEPNQIVLYPTPGKTLLSTSPTNARIRCCYMASNGDFYVASGENVYYVDTSFNFNLVGSLGGDSGLPVKMADNGTNIVVCDGTLSGFYINMTNKGGWTPILPAGSIYDNNTATSGWVGSNYLDFTDTYIIANEPNTPSFYISDSEDITFNSLQFAGKSAYPDYIQAIAVVHRVIWLIGSYSTEVWYDSGGGDLYVPTTDGTTSQTNANTFPFEIMPGVAIDYGCAARYSVAKAETTLMWLAQDKNGNISVLQGSGYNVKRISNHAIEYQFSTYSEISDATAYCYNQIGHSFYVLNFPTADKTWVFDLATGAWHERCWVDANGFEHRDRGAWSAFVYGKNVIGDWQNGNLYSLDLNNYTDNGSPIKRIKGLPQIIDKDNLQRITFSNLKLDMEVGSSILPNDSPMISMRFSDDHGRTWSNPIEQPLGNTGNYMSNISWNRLGQSRYRVFEIEWSCNAKTALAAAYVVMDPLKQTP